MFDISITGLTQLICIIGFIILVNIFGTWLRNKKIPDTASTNTKNLKILRGPRSFPLIGSLHLLRGPSGPFHTFTKLAKEYGDIYAIKLGVTKCVVVSSYNLIKEVLVTKGHQFGGRPDFLRFHAIFGGDKNNSLAFCDWSEVQRLRRSLARNFCSPRIDSLQHQQLSNIITLEVMELLTTLNKPEMQSVINGEKSLKPLLLGTLANIFTTYMCSTRFNYDDDEFKRIVRLFDEIFWDINKGYLVDFIPWLKPFYWSAMKRLSSWSTDIRSFILRRIINNKYQLIMNDTIDSVPKDFTDTLLLHLKSNTESDLTWTHIMFELEDFLGGHSAIGNLIMLILAHIALKPQVQRNIQAECDVIVRANHANNKNDKFVSLNHRAIMPYTDAVIWETLRITSSPIVPHVATVDTNIANYFIAKGTIIFINNLQLNSDVSYWGNDASLFRPERFLSKIDNKIQVIRPNCFIPFSMGKRTCIGQRLVNALAFVLITAILSHFDVFPTTTDDLKRHLHSGSIAVSPDSFNLIFKPRS